MQEPTSDSPSLLIVDDDATLRGRLARAFRERGYEVREAGSHEEAMQLSRVDPPEMAVVDLKMPGPGGLELLRDLKKLDAETRIVILTGYGSIATTIDAMRLGATYYLPKPADADQILAAFSKGKEPPLAATTESLPPSLDRVKWEHISMVLADSGGNVSEAARRLRLHRRTLQRILNKIPPRG